MRRQLYAIAPGGARPPWRMAMLRPQVELDSTLTAGSNRIELRASYAVALIGASVAVSRCCRRKNEA